MEEACETLRRLLWWEVFRPINPAWLRLRLGLSVDMAEDARGCGAGGVCLEEHRGPRC